MTRVPLGRSVEPKKYTETAEESAKIQRTRRKLKRRLGVHQSCVSQKALERQRIAIYKRAAKQAAVRTLLRRKTIALFDGNQNAAENSSKIRKRARALRQQLQWPAVDTPVNT